MSDALGAATRYAAGVLVSDPTFTDFLAPLTATFGDRLALHRDGNRVEWAFEGQSAIVELRPGATVDAHFVARPSTDTVTSKRAFAVYRAGSGGYPLSARGCTRLVTDIVDFFSGVREPRFCFVAALALDSGR